MIEHKTKILPDISVNIALLKNDIVTFKFTLENPIANNTSLSDKDLSVN
jgi:hypothetical protein